MKRLNILIALAAIFVLILSACSPALPQETAAVTSPAGTEVLETQEQGVVTEAPATEAQEVETQPAATEEQVTEAPAETETPEATEEPTSAAETATPEAGTGGTGGRPTTDQGQQFLLTNLINSSVRFPNSSLRGDIVDFVLNLNTEQVEYVLVRLAETSLGPERVVPVPWTALTQDQTGNTYSLSFNLAVEQDVPTVDLTAGIDFTDPEWDAEIRSFWETRGAPGTQGAGTGETEGSGSESSGTGSEGASSEEDQGSEGAETEAQSAQFTLASNVLNAFVYFNASGGVSGEGAETSSDSEEGTLAAPAGAPAVVLGQSLGRIDDILADPATGQLLFFLIAPEASFKLQRGIQVPVPVNLLSVGPRSKTMVVSFNLENIDLSNLPTIDINQLPDFSQQDWQDQIRTFWESLNR